MFNKTTRFPQFSRVSGAPHTIICNIFNIEILQNIPQKISIIDDSLNSNVNNSFLRNLRMADMFGFTIPFCAVTMLYEVPRGNYNMYIMILYHHYSIEE